MNWKWNLMQKFPFKMSSKMKSDTLNASQKVELYIYNISMSGLSHVVLIHIQILLFLQKQFSVTEK